MDKQEQHVRLTRVLEKTRVFENLLTNPDFIVWRDESVRSRLEDIKNAILSVDRKQANWKEAVCDGIIAYQEALLTYETLFELSARTAEKARKDLKKLSEA